MNSDRSSSLIVWLTFAFDPWTVTLPALVARPLVEVFILAWSCGLSVSVRLDTAQPDGCYLHPVLKLDLAACIDTDVLEGLAGEIVVGTAGLKRLEDFCLIDAARLICVYRTKENASAQI